MNWGPTAHREQLTHRQKVELAIQEVLTPFMAEKATDESLKEARVKVDDFLDYLKEDGHPAPREVLLEKSSTSIAWGINW